MEDTKTPAVVELNLALIPLVHDYLSGASMEKLALKYELQVSEVNDFLARSEVKRFISGQLKNTGYANKKKRLDLLSRIVDEKIEFAQENEMPLSSKDLLEILKLLREEENDLHKLAGDLQEEGGKAQYVQIINSLKMESD